MEKNITLQQSDIRVINAKQVQTSALLDGMKKAATTPMEWFLWWRRRGSNSRPYGCEPYALPAELRPHTALLL